MKQIEFTKKAIVQAVIVGIGAVGLMFLGASQRMGVGQAYQCVSVNGNVIGCVSGQTDMDAVLKQTR